MRLLLDTHALLWWSAGDHKDPFDRMLAAQAIAEGLEVVTIDPKLSELGARVLW